jgi:exosome complex RNA-binding protein Rrp42 (RNase PH superfamily)
MKNDKPRSSRGSLTPPLMSTGCPYRRHLVSLTRTLILLQTNHVSYAPSRKHVLADPTSFEAPLLDSTIMVVLQGADAISVSQLGVGTSEVDKLLTDCVEISRQRQRAVEKILAEGL